MRYLALLALLALCGALQFPTAVMAQDDPRDAVAQRDLAEFRDRLPGVYTNEEQVYFHNNLGLDDATRLPRLTLTIQPDGDDFVARTLNPVTGRTTEARLSYFVENGAIRSREVREGQADCERVFTEELGQYRGIGTGIGGCSGVVIAGADGFVFGDPETPFRMLRAQPFSCWISPRKRDGSYGFAPNLLIHDQGGRVWVEGEDHDRVGIKMRNVRWPSGRNRDSLVLYAYRGQDKDSAISYAWTGPDSDRLAINLRWMQASCTRGDADDLNQLITTPKD